MLLSLPPDRNVLALKSQPCHLLSSNELESRYTCLRREEHERYRGLWGLDWTRSAALDPRNANRNRYSNVLPWDHSRVRLPVAEGFSDYINASWIQLGRRTYIATQGPLPNTVSHFWHMVYAYGGNPAVIVMLTPVYERNTEKCTMYWPNSKNSSFIVKASPEDGLDFGFKIQVESVSKHAHFTLSTLNIIPDKEELSPHKVHHIYHYSWLDFSKPDADVDVLSLIHLMNGKLKNPRAPPIVHCSAGIGRTGTFIAIDALVSCLEHNTESSRCPSVSPIWSLPPEQLQYKEMPVKEESSQSGLDNHFLEYDLAIPQFDISSISSSSSSLRSAFLNDLTASTRVRPVKCPSVSQSIREEENEVKDGVCVQSSLDSNECVKPDFLSEHNARDSAAISDFNRSVSPYSISLSGSPVTSDSNLSFQSLNGTAKTGPVCSPRFKDYSSTRDELANCKISPQNIDVFAWYDPKDPIMSVSRCMRLQRPKMVQGVHQLGYIYDQFETAQQLARPSRIQVDDAIKSTETSPASKTSFLNGNTNNIRERENAARFVKTTFKSKLLPSLSLFSTAKRVDSIKKRAILKSSV